MTASRRDFLKLAGAASVAAIAFRDALRLEAYPLGLPLGLQLYSLRNLLPTDFDGTLKAVAAAGYTEVEAAGYYAMSAQDFKQSMDTAGLHCVSAHYPLSMLQPQLESILAYAKELGLQYVVCSSPSLEDPSRVRLTPKDPGYHDAWVQAFTLNDWKWNAEQFNQIGAKVKGYGMRFGYHNHTT
jgi:sugar phosphate isomerase/epimerase